MKNQLLQLPLLLLSMMCFYGCFPQSEEMIFEIDIDSHNKQELIDQTLDALNKRIKSLSLFGEYNLSFNAVTKKYELYLKTITLKEDVLYILNTPGVFSFWETYTWEDLSKFKFLSYTWKLQKEEELDPSLAVFLKYIPSNAAGYESCYFFVPEEDKSDFLSALHKLLDEEFCIPTKIAYMKHDDAFYEILLLKPSEKGSPLINNSQIVEIGGRKGADSEILTIKLNDEGTEIFRNYSLTHLRERAAIMLDDELLLSPRLNSPIENGHMTVTGKFTMSQVVNFMTIFSSGPYMVNVQCKPLNSY